MRHCEKCGLLVRDDEPAYVRVVGWKRRGLSVGREPEVIQVQRSNKVAHVACVLGPVVSEGQLTVDDVLDVA